MLNEKQIEWLREHSKVFATMLEIREKREAEERVTREKYKDCEHVVL